MIFIIIIIVIYTFFSRAGRRGRVRRRRQPAGALVLPRAAGARVRRQVAVRARAQRALAGGPRAAPPLAGAARAQLSCDGLPHPPTTHYFKMARARFQPPGPRLFVSGALLFLTRFLCSAARGVCNGALACPCAVSKLFVTFGLNYDSSVM